MNCMGISVLPIPVTLAIQVPTDVNHVLSNKNTSFHITCLLHFSEYMYFNTQSHTTKCCARLCIKYIYNPQLNCTNFKCKLRSPEKHW